eukprot:6190519-Pleurochrysis_carterae.AAC.3
MLEAHSAMASRTGALTSYGGLVISQRCSGRKASGSSDSSIPNSSWCSLGGEASASSEKGTGTLMKPALLDAVAAIAETRNLAA